MKKLNLQDVLEIHRITCVEQNCCLSGITQDVARMAAGQVAEEDASLGRWLRDRADEMDRPVDISDIASSLRSHGVH